MIGIGGTSMSGIAEILKRYGFIVTGSDASESELVDKLRESNIPVVVGHDLENLRKADLVVYSAAILETDIEMQEKMLTTQLRAAQEELKSAEKAEEEGIKNAAPKYA